MHSRFLSALSVWKSGKNVVAWIRITLRIPMETPDPLNEDPRGLKTSEFDTPGHPKDSWGRNEKNLEGSEIKPSQYHHFCVEFYLFHWSARRTWFSPESCCATVLQKHISSTIPDCSYESFLGLIESQPLLLMVQKCGDRNVVIYKSL